LDEILKGTAKKKNKRVPFKAVYSEVNGEIIYLLHDEGKDKFYKTLRDPQGRLHKQKETPLRGNSIPTAQWGDQPTHIQFPRPKEYSLGDIETPLDRTIVRQLTLEFSRKRRTPPTASKEWDRKMIEIKQTPPDWATVADRYATRFLTLKDGYTHFKNITHRAIFTRNGTPGNQKKDQLCRLCHKTRESSTHMEQCRIIQTLFSRINRLSATEHKICSALRKAGQGNDATSEILFLSSRSEVPLSVGSLLRILWKYTLINWYKVDIDRKKS
jgi:hypothetical protein